ncbi:MAG: single-stranded-DNA-specific exonuclease RecJ [Oscillospiraceae bacterium]|nr:single-stranded-DNA-specific exonuclease RecJ [Oscillospiraceae bacterium]
MIKKWNVPRTDDNKAAKLAREGGISPLAAKVLVGMGIEDIGAAAEFFGQESDGSEKEWGDPFGIKDMRKACDIINETVDRGGLMCVYGDYDCDGITSTAVLTGYLENIGASVTAYINERSMGFGLNADAIKSLCDQGIELIITVDNGIAAIEEAKLCKKLGIELIVTDHHQPGDELPDCAAVVDPHRADDTSEYKDFCGCGVALKLIAAMEGGDMEIALEQYSELAAIATVADVVPLTGENRRLVKRGLRMLENTENVGLTKLIEHAGLKKPYTSTGAAFVLAPRINAAGRIASPMDALRLLMTEDDRESEDLANEICELNTRRRSFEEVITRDIMAQIEADPAKLDRRILFFSGVGWHHGVIGIVAARMVERYGRPAFLMSADSEGEELRGSARSFGKLNVFEALSACKDHLSKFGGHAGAGGFSLDFDRAAAFDSALQAYAAKVMTEPMPMVIETRGIISPSDLTEENVRGLDILEPFGECNPSPVFVVSDAVIQSVYPMSGGKHTKLSVKLGDSAYDAVMFGMKTDEFPYKQGDRVNMLASPSLNTWNGVTKVQLRAEDIRREGVNQNALIAAEDFYRRFRRGEVKEKAHLAHITPDRNALAAVYRLLSDKPVSIPALYTRLDGVNFCAYLIALDIFEEAGLAHIDRAAERVCRIAAGGKADLEITPTMKKLKNA